MTPEIQLHGQTYLILRTLSGAQLVVRRTGPSMWRVADVAMTRRVLDGVTLRVVGEKP